MTANREAFRKFVRTYLREAGEPFDRDECEPEDGATFDRLLADKKTTQHALALARNATRRAAAKVGPLHSAPQSIDVDAISDDDLKRGTKVLLAEWAGDQTKTLHHGLRAAIRAAVGPQP